MPVYKELVWVMRHCHSTQLTQLTFAKSWAEVPHMRVHPMRGKLAPAQNTNVVVSFMPKASDDFFLRMKFKFFKLELSASTSKSATSAVDVGTGKVQPRPLHQVRCDP